MTRRRRATSDDAHPRDARRDSSDEERRRSAKRSRSDSAATVFSSPARKTSEELADLEEAVEQFERMVERGGGDLMVDEPVSGGSPIAPDEPDFVLPARKPSESAACVHQTHPRRRSTGRTQGKHAPMAATALLHDDRSRHCSAVHRTVVRVGAGGREGSAERSRAPVWRSFASVVELHAVRRAGVSAVAIAAAGVPRPRECRADTRRCRGPECICCSIPSATSSTH